VKPVAKNKGSGFTHGESKHRVRTTIIKKDEFENTSQGLLIVGGDRIKSFGVIKELRNDDLEPGTKFLSFDQPGEEVLTYPIQGSLLEEDSEGRRVLLRSGDLEYYVSPKPLTHNTSSVGDHYRGIRVRMVFPAKHRLAETISKFIPLSQIPESRIGTGTVTKLSGPDGALQLFCGAIVSDVKLFGEASFPDFKEELLIYVLSGKGEFSVNDSPLSLAAQDALYIKGSSFRVKVKSLDTRRVRFMFFALK
jgi:redox-sensitive bicupin YhaK (pirin superfamily)